MKFTGRKLIKNKGLPISDLYTHIVMQDDVLSLTPVRFGMAGGTLKLNQLFPTAKMMQ